MRVYSGRRYETRDPIVARNGASSSIPVVGAEVQITVSARHNITDAAELPLEQAFLASDSARSGIHSKTQQMRAAQSPHEQVIRELREPLPAVERRAARRDRGVVERNRLTHGRHRPTPFDRGPSIVNAAIDHVYLVVARCAMFRFPEVAGCRMPINSLRVPVTVRIDRWAEGIGARRRAIGIDAENLSCQRRDVLRELFGGGIAGGDVEKAVRTEAEPAAVVNDVRGNVVEKEG